MPGCITLVENEPPLRDLPGELVEQMLYQPGVELDRIDMGPCIQKCGRENSPTWTDLKDAATLDRPRINDSAHCTGVVQKVLTVPGPQANPLLIISSSCFIRPAGYVAVDRLSICGPATSSRRNRHRTFL